MGYDNEHYDCVDYVDYCYMLDAPTCYEDDISRNDAKDFEISSLESDAENHVYKACYVAKRYGQDQGIDY